MGRFRQRLKYLKIILEEVQRKRRGFVFGVV